MSEYLNDALIAEMTEVDELDEDDKRNISPQHMQELLDKKILFSGVLSRVEERLRVLA